jgi:anti-sigma factor RsiW
VAQAELRSVLDELLRVIADNEATSEFQHSAELARVEADAAVPRTMRLRELMNAIVTGAGKVGVVAQAALNVLTVINKLPR